MDITSGGRRCQAATTAVAGPSPAPRRPPRQRGGGRRAHQGRRKAVRGAQERARGTVTGVHGGALRQ